MFKTRLDNFGNDFGRFLNFWKFFKNISKTRPSLEHWAKKFLEKITPKHVQNTFGQFGNNFGRFLNFENFSTFRKHFEDSTLLGTLAQKNFSKNYPKTCSKHVWTLFGTILGIFGKFENCSTFWKHFEDSTLHGTLGKKNSEKLPQNMFKTRLDTFGNDFGHFRNFENFLIYLKAYRRLDPPWNTG